MNIFRLVEKKFIRLFLVITLFPLQSCSSTLIGEKLENSFDTIDNSKNLEKTNDQLQKSNEIKKVKSRIKDDQRGNQNDFGKILKENSISNKDRLPKNSIKSIKKITFNPQPYRIILKLSSANPSAPAETVTEALRKAGVQFEVEKIERFKEEKFSKDTSSRR